MRTLLSTIVCLALTATPVFASGKKSPDGYNWNKASQLVNSNVSVKVVFVKNHIELEKKYYEVNGDKMRLADSGGASVKLKAFSTINMSARSCTIYAIDPAVDYVPEYIGHELMHCLYGNWHV